MLNLHIVRLHLILRGQNAWYGTNTQTMKQRVKSVIWKANLAMLSSLSHWKEMFAWCTLACLFLSGTHLAHCPVEILRSHVIWPLIGQEWRFPRVGMEEEGNKEEGESSDVRTEAILGRHMRRGYRLGRSDPLHISRLWDPRAFTCRNPTTLCSQLGWRRDKWSKEILPTLVDPTWENCKVSNVGVNGVMRRDKTFFPSPQTTQYYIYSLSCQKHTTMMFGPQM